jgi:hypothetical protein
MTVDDIRKGVRADEGHSGSPDQCFRRVFQKGAVEEDAGNR